MMELNVFYLQGEKLLRIGALSANTALHGLYESGTYLIQRPDERARLYVDDALVAVKTDDASFWQWSPGYFAGEVAFELEMPARGTPIRFVADIGPARHKSGRAQYAEYLNDIVDYAPHLVLGTEPAQHGLGGRSDTALSIWLRYARLRQFVDRYVAGLQRIIERPIIRPRSRREQVPLPMVKRVDAATLGQLARSPHVLAALSDPGLAVDPRELTLDVPFHEPTYDNPANRLITRQLGEVRRLVRQLIGSMLDFTEQTSETRSDIVSRLPRRIAYLRRLDRQLALISCRQPFSEVDVCQSSAAELNAVSGNPHYSLTHRLGVRLLRCGMSELADDEQHYLAPTWEIYEAWCFVTIAQQLEISYPGYDWHLNEKPTSADFLLRGRRGAKSISLYSQLTCPSMERMNSYGYCSITRERRPDFVLEIADSENKRFICLDSKYTATRHRIMESMGAAHIYRDSLRLEGRPPWRSLILVPANPDLDRLAEREYQDRHGTGCVTLAAASEAVELVVKCCD